MYTGYELTEQSRNMLAKEFPPTNPTWLGHHITEKFGVPSDQPPPEPPSKVVVIGYLEADGIEGFLVSIDGDTNRPSGGKYHITWSIDKEKGRKPVDTNKLVDSPKWITPIPINVIPKTFTKSTEKSIKENSTTFLNYFTLNT